MALKNRKNVQSIKKNVKLSRKQQRKQKRKEKKLRRNEFYTNRKKPGQFVLNPSRNSSPSNTEIKPKLVQHKLVESKENNLREIIKSDRILSTEELRKKEKNKQLKIQNEMRKQRKKQLLEANIKEDHNIRQLEKQLKLNKRKSKSIPKSFIEDGLDYLLEVCGSDSVENAGTYEQELYEVNDEFEEDFALMVDKTNINKKGSKNIPNEDSDSNDIDEFELDDLESNSEDEMGNTLEENDIDINDEHLSESEGSDSDIPISKKKLEKNQPKHTKKVIYKDANCEISNLDGKTSKDLGKRKKNGETENTNQKLKKIKTENTKQEVSDADSDNDLNYSEDDSDLNGGSGIKGVAKKNPDGTWEDIYGRLRARNGEILDKNEGKYIPPAMRAKLDTSTSEDKLRLEKLSRLNKQLKGLLNRLAESNMHSIASQIEELFMNNSRNDMNNTLTNLIMESLISPVITPERLLIEHIVLIAVLHANIGTEVGAHLLQTVVKKFNEYLNADHEVENKVLDNTVNVISQLYNFKLFESKLLYEILQTLSNKFEEKDIECILHILKSVGFTLRKDDPLALKNLILDLQKRASDASAHVRDNPRVKFMLDILLAIKNNNVSKIPNYDTSYADHLKKIMKSFIRKGNYVQQLNISLEDLLNADKKGKWWIVGSAWTGNIPENDEKTKKLNKSDGFSQKLLELAGKQRMNTDVRRNIFCIIMSAEDYLDAFEKLLHLGLKNQQEREIVNVILHCCLHEKVYNPYYAVLAQKFCEYDRKYQMTIKYSVWDKLKALSNHSGSQISHLAKMLTHLFIEKGLPISTLKVVQFSELDKLTLRFMRQILLGILLYKDTEPCLSVFEKVAQSDKLKVFRESIRLFIHHFLLRNLSTEKVPDDQKVLLETRAKMVEKVLTSKDGKLMF